MTSLRRWPTPIAGRRNRDHTSDLSVGPIFQGDRSGIVTRAASIRKLLGKSGAIAPETSSKSHAIRRSLTFRGPKRRHSNSFRHEILRLLAIEGEAGALVLETSSKSNAIADECPSKGGCDGEPFGISPRLLA